MFLKDMKENIEKHFELLEKTNIALETSVKEKMKIVEENKNKKALIKINDLPDKYILGRIEPKNGIFFGLRVLEHRTEINYCETIPYENLSELILCGD